MERLVKVGTMPGRLVEVAVSGNETVREVFELAGVEVLSGYEVKADNRNISLDEKIEDTKLLLQSKMIKGNNDMIKVGTMPGRLVEVAVTGEESVKEVFELAGIEILSGYEVKADNRNVSLDDKVAGTKLLLQSKMIKGNADAVKVGTMPGRLVEVAVTGEETVREVFELAGIEVLSGYEVKADSQNISLDDKIGNAKLLLQSKLIKGNR